MDCYYYCRVYLTRCLSCCTEKEKFWDNLSSEKNWIEKMCWLFWSKYWGWPIQGGKNYIHFFRIEYIPIPSPVNPYIERQHLDKQFDLEPIMLWLYQLTKNIAAKIAPRISSSLRYLGKVFDNLFIWSRSPILVGAECAGTAESC